MWDSVSLRGTLHSVPKDFPTARTNTTFDPAILDAHVKRQGRFRLRSIAMSLNPLSQYAVKIVLIKMFAQMGALKYVEELQKKKQSDVLRFLLRVRCWEVSLLLAWHDMLSTLAASCGSQCLAVRTFTLLKCINIASPTERHPPSISSITT